MKQTFLRVTAVTLTLLMLLTICIFPQAAEPEDEITILFTHDLHSHLLPSVSEEGDGEYGGYARLMTLIRQQKTLDPNAILIDGGDFSMGSLFQTAYPTSAIELRMMGAMGYDATTFGNHEFDYLQSGLKSMLKAAVDSGDPVPPIVCANYLTPDTGVSGNDSELPRAFEDYGVKKYVIGSIHSILVNNGIAGRHILSVDNNGVMRCGILEIAVMKGRAVSRGCT